MNNCWLANTKTQNINILKKPLDTMEHKTNRTLQSNDEYIVIHSKEKGEINIYQDDEIVEPDNPDHQLTRAFNPPESNALEDKIQQVTCSQGLSLKSLHRTKFSTKSNNVIKFAPICRPITRSFQANIFNDQIPYLDYQRCQHPGGPRKAQECH